MLWLVIRLLWPTFRRRTVGRTELLPLYIHMICYRPWTQSWIRACCFKWRRFVLSIEKRERSNACAQTQQCDHGIDAVGEKQSKYFWAKFTAAFSVTCIGETFNMPSFDMPCNLAYVKNLLYDRTRLLDRKDGFIWHQDKASSIKKSFCER